MLIVMKGRLFLQRSFQNDSLKIEFKKNNDSSPKRLYKKYKKQ